MASEAKPVKVEILRATTALGRIVEQGEVIDLEPADAYTLIRLGKAQVFEAKAAKQKAAIDTSKKETS